MLPYLCIEVLQEIGSQLPNSDQKNLRAVCKELNVAIDPLFYTFFVLRGDRMRGEDGLKIIERLAAGQIGWSHHCKTIHILPGSKAEKGEAIGPKWYPTNAEFPNLLVTAIASMQNTQTVMWNVRARDPQWVREAICDSLSTLSHLTNLRLQIEGGFRLQLAPLPRLTKLRIETMDWQPVHPEEICRLVGRGHNLTCLHLTGHCDWSQVWTMVRTTSLRPSPSTRIRLKDVRTRIVTPDLITYLSSYSGLERLTLEKFEGSQPQIDSYADAFFNDVLPQHSQSLVVLNCPAAYEGRWCFRMEVANSILQLRKLEKLHISVSAVDVIDAEPAVNAVTLLLNTAALLPALRLLHISPASRRRHFDIGLKTGIEDFTSHIESAAVVYTDAHYYGLAPAISDEGDYSTVLVYRILDPESPRIAQVKGLVSQKERDEDEEW
ncbi:F-box domain-containing protein [Mycena sanguinolenta]|uniref:F-box domain-containing protein n=1 Tax=Mycena sanguinolenta TaxID=230812 RepID=A0A8H7DGG8_9AGAR|nr:F-box domain-containing protein [Mycena sanguinolenta]